MSDRLPPPNGSGRHEEVVFLTPEARVELLHGMGMKKWVLLTMQEMATIKAGIKDYKIERPQLIELCYRLKESLAAVTADFDAAGGWAGPETEYKSAAVVESRKWADFPLPPRPIIDPFTPVVKKDGKP